MLKNYFLICVFLVTSVCSKVIFAQSNFYFSGVKGVLVASNSSKKKHKKAKKKKRKKHKKSKKIKGSHKKVQAPELNKSTEVKPVVKEEQAPQQMPEENQNVPSQNEKALDQSLESEVDGLINGSSE